MGVIFFLNFVPAFENSVYLDQLAEAKPADQNPHNEILLINKIKLHYIIQI